MSETVGPASAPRAAGVDPRAAITARRKSRRAGLMDGLRLAHAVEKRAMPGQDAPPRVFVHVQAPDAVLERAAEQDPVPAREHVEPFGDDDVIDLGLGEQERELALHRLELLVAEQSLGPEARAVDDDGLGELPQLLAALELPHHDPPPGEAHV